VDRQGFLDKFTIDVSGDWIHYGSNNEAGTGSQSLTQEATYGAYPWLSYDATSTLRRVMPTAIQAVGEPPGRCTSWELGSLDTQDFDGRGRQ